MVLKVQLYDLDFPFYPVQMNLNIYVQFICNEICWIEIIAELVVLPHARTKYFEVSQNFQFLFTVQNDSVISLKANFNLHQQTESIETNRLVLWASHLIGESLRAFISAGVLE